MRPIVPILLLVALLSACGGPLSLLTGGGPNVAANTQAGQTNTQTLGTTELTDQRVEGPVYGDMEQSTGSTSVRSERVEKVYVRNTDPWVIAILLLLAGFVIPSPQEIARWIASRFEHA